MAETNPNPKHRSVAVFCGRPASLFTLLEILIATAVFSLVLTVLVAFSREVSKSWVRLRNEEAVFRDLLGLDRGLEAILPNAIPFLWSDEDGEQVPFFIGESDYMRTAYLHRLNNVADGAIRFVEIHLQDGDLMAFYTERPYLDWGDVEGTGRSAVLASDVDSVEFSYADWSAEAESSWDDGMEWLDEWDVEERQELPLGILVVVRWQDGRTESWFRRTAAQGFRERLGKWKPAPKSD